MRFSERFRGLKSWVQKELCDGRIMKAPGPNMDISEIVTQEPKCYLAWAPGRMDQTGRLREDTVSVVPGIQIIIRNGRVNGPAVCPEITDGNRPQNHVKSYNFKWNFIDSVLCNHRIGRTSRARLLPRATNQHKFDYAVNDKRCRPARNQGNFNCRNAFNSNVKCEFIFK